jgi:lipopolysaccharide assembly outer membrane protein LptD (OstA)
MIKLVDGLAGSCIRCVPGHERSAEKPPIQIKTIEPNARLDYDRKTGVATAPNGVNIVYGDAVLTARQVTLDEQTGDFIAEGDVYLQRGKEVWRGDRIRYNFTSKEIATDKFHAGMAPFLVGVRVFRGADEPTEPPPTLRDHG